MSAVGTGAQAAPPRKAAPSNSMRSLAIRGSMWSTIAFGASNAIRLIGNILLANLLLPEYFGMTVIVGTLMSGLQMFSDIGIGPSVVQNPRGRNRAFLNTAWTMQVIRGVIVWLAACALAYPFAARFGDADSPDTNAAALTPVILIVSIAALIAGFNSTSLFTLQRRMDVRKIALLDVAVQIVQTIVMVAWAYFHPSVWALVAGTITAAIVRAIASHYLEPAPGDRFQWEPKAVKSLMHFGGWIFVSTVFTFFAQQGDKLLFGDHITKEVLGVYSIAAMLAIVPLDVSRRIGESVAFPAYSRTIHEGGDLRRTFRTIRYPISIGGALLITGAAAVGPDFVLMAYKKDYFGAAAYVPIIAAGGLFQLFEFTVGAAVLAAGNAKIIAYGNLAKVIGMLIFVTLGLMIGGWIPDSWIAWEQSHLAGMQEWFTPQGTMWTMLENLKNWVAHTNSHESLQWAIAGVAIADLGRYAVFAYAAKRLHLSFIKHDVVLFLGCAAAYWFAKEAAGLLGLHDGTILALLVKGVLVTACFAYPCWHAFNKVFRRR